jgi:hypothetical protein
MLAILKVRAASRKQPLRSLHLGCDGVFPSVPDGIAAVSTPRNSSGAASMTSPLGLISYAGSSKSRTFQFVAEGDLTSGLVELGVVRHPQS